MGKLFDELKAMKEAYDRKLQHEGQAAVKDAFKDLFDKFPEARSISWRQYTPYFCDGDPCYFGVHEFDVSLGTDETLKEQIKELKAETVKAAKAADYKKAQALKEQVEQLEDRLNDEEEEYGYGESLYSLASSTDPREVALAEAVRVLKRELPDDVLESVFGDHVQIVATREGFNTKEVQHD
jgi:hypothetical protein